VSRCAGMRRFRTAVDGGAGTLAIMAGMLGALGPTMPANAAPAAAARPAAASSSSVSCSYIIPYDFSTGFLIEVTQANTGTAPAPFPPLTWTWPGTQQIASAFGARVVQSGATVTVTASPAGLLIPPGGSVSFGFVAFGTLPPVLPIPCTRVS
jgi:hypothetical protein